MRWKVELSSRRAEGWDPIDDVEIQYSSFRACKTKAMEWTLHKVGRGKIDSSFRPNWYNMIDCTCRFLMSPTHASPLLSYRIMMTPIGFRMADIDPEMKKVNEEGICLF